MRRKRSRRPFGGSAELRTPASRFPTARARLWSTRPLLGVARFPVASFEPLELRYHRAARRDQYIPVCHRVGAQPEPITETCTRDFLLAGGNPMSRRFPMFTPPCLLPQPRPINWAICAPIRNRCSAVSICWHSECRGDAEPGSATSPRWQRHPRCPGGFRNPRLSCRGTTSSNPSPSSEESANYRFSRVGIDAFPRSRLPNCG